VRSSKVGVSWCFAFERFRYKPFPVSPTGLFSRLFHNVKVYSPSLSFTPSPPPEPCEVQGIVLHPMWCRANPPLEGEGIVGGFPNSSPIQRLCRNSFFCHPELVSGSRNLMIPLDAETSSAWHFSPFPLLRHSLSRERLERGWDWVPLRRQYHCTVPGPTD